jgi:hypothetical protein
MKLPPPKTLLANVLCLLALGWLYGGELLDAVRARSAEVSAFLAPPSLVWPAVVLAATGGGLGVLLWGMWRGQGVGFKGYRLLPILLVSALFFDLALAESRVPLRPEDVASLSLSQFQERARALANGRTVPTDPAVLRPLLDALGPPPYLVRGARARAWSLQVRQDCQGPIREAPGLEVGTLLYCVAPGRERAWITLVGLPAGERFGQPAVLSVDGEPQVAVVQPVRPEEGVEAASEAPFGVVPEAPSPEGAEESSDAGRMAPAPSL